MHDESKSGDLPFLAPQDLRSIGMCWSQGVTSDGCSSFESTTGTLNGSWSVFFYGLIKGER